MSLSLATDFLGCTIKIGLEVPYSSSKDYYELGVDELKIGDKKMSGKLTVKYINGNKDVFEFSPSTTPGSLAGTQLKELLNSPAIVLKLGEEFEIIPMANIQSISVVPARDEMKELKLPGVLVAKRIS